MTKPLTENIIPFPNLHERLFQFGKEALENDEIEKAITLLEQAKAYVEKDERVSLALIAAYMEKREWTKAKHLTKDMLLKGIGPYFVVFESYIRTCIELQEYAEAEKHLQAIIEEQKEELPVDVKDRLQRLLGFSTKRKEQLVPSRTLHLKDDAYWFMNLQLFQQDIRPYLAEIQLMLIEKDRHPFLKTVMLHALIDQNYSQPVKIHKFGEEITVVPSETKPFQTQLHDTIQVLSDHLENENPTLYDNLKEMMKRHFFLLFPFQMEPKHDHDSLACAYHLKGLEMLGLEIDDDRLYQQYRAKKDNVEIAFNQIEQQESIPFPEG